MVSERTFTDAGRALAFLLLYGLLATALAPRFAPYPRVVAALVVAVAVFAAADALPALFRGERPLVDADGPLYSVRGLVLLVAVVLVTAVTVDWLRRATAAPDALATAAGFLVGVVVVLGPVVAYYWRRSVRQQPA